MKQDILQTLKILVAAIILSFGASYVYAWTSPAQAPLNGNTPAPVNIGASAQSKSGKLAIGSSATPAVTLDVTGNIGAGNAFFSKNVRANSFTLGGITITSWPSGGSSTETDPTVLSSVKDGVSWNEVTNKPAGFADGVDNTGIFDIKTVTASYFGRGSGSVTANCPTRYILTGGGGSGNIATIRKSFPQGNGWTVEADLGTRSGGTIIAYAICAQIR